MVLFVSSCWVLIRSSLFFLTSLITTYFFRFQIENSSKKDDSNCDGPQQKENQIVLATNELNSDDSENDEFGQNEISTSNFSFKFQFQSSDDIIRSIEKSELSISEGNNYHFFSEKDYTGFIEEPKVLCLSVKEAYVNSESSIHSNKETPPNSKLADRFLLEGGFEQFKQEKSVVHEKQLNCSDLDFFTREEKPEKLEVVVFSEDQLGKKDVSGEIKFLSEKDFIGSDSEQESISFSDIYSVKNQIIDSSSDSFLSEGEFIEFELKSEAQNYSENQMGMDFNEEIQNSKESHLQNSGNSDTESVNVSDDESSQINYSDLSDEFLSEHDFKRSKWELEDTDEEETEPIKDTKKSEKTHLEDPSILHKEYINFTNRPSSIQTNDSCNSEHESEDTDRQKSDDSNRLESLWEHQDLIEQLRLELKKVRATGLPTIFEESESPKIIDDLKPWKFEDKFLKEDPVGEMQKFYNSYRERMRKFDILNYQKMYAIGFLQLKDPFQPEIWRKISIPAITSLLSHNLWLGKRRKSDTDPSEKFVKELLSDLETVYVGQACLTWEILEWQYRKAKEVPESDPRGHRRQYNQVAGELQQFQVLAQRFLENEPFQGPRVQNYVKSRCVLRNLLQVPAIREDCLKDKKEGRRKGDNATTSEMLVQLLEESMRIFWEFIKADKDETSVILKGFLGTQPDFQDPADSELFIDIRASLQMKEKRLKDLVRSGNCLVKRFQKQQDRTDQALFFSQVDMKLVSRVLRMSRITSDQLLWCHKKLNRITLTDRKLHREPSFLLFPC
ncbi:uncharacterized protein LOC143889640 isoform X1 [Tasmannia lanceolata]|uniref:uncharacterized protein LOC143889640 isoform X1 n=1 Tax=Tasmannia lanceolata TaxID=3420 RepID=UPI0040631A3B